MSILFVIIGHLHRDWGGALLLASFGVHVFFVLSGYLITGLLQKEHNREGRVDLVAFYRRRCFRIFPAAFTYIVIIALLSPASRSALVYAATYTISYHPNDIPLLFQHLWSLSVEEQFYLLWPLALLLAFPFRARVAWITMLVAAGFRLALALSPSPYAFAYLHFSFPGTMDSIAAGCLLAIFEPQIRQHCRWMAESTAIVIAIPVTAWTVDAVCWDGGMSTFWGAVPLMIALWIFLLVERRDWILNNPVASAIGVLSYSLYLWQQAFTLEHQHSTVLALLMLAGCAVASYTFVEKPMLKLGVSIESRKPLSEEPSRNLAAPARD
jgi:peptidoglycan/LPS O-acetylase OafA/YrhL